MQPESLIQNAFSYLRLLAGSCAVFLGLVIIFYRVNKEDPYWWTGVLIAGIGLAAALQETAYVGARFLAAFLRPAPEDTPDQTSAK